MKESDKSNLIFDSKEAIAKKLFTFLIKEKGLEEKDLVLCAPSQEEQRDFTILSSSNRYSDEEVKALQQSLSMLLSIFYHNEEVRDFIFQGLDSLPNSICLYDKDSCLIYGNSDFCNYMHLQDREAAYGKPIDDILLEIGTKFTSIKRPQGYMKIKDVLRYGKPVIDWEVEVVSESVPNDYMLASNDMYPLFDNQGKVSGAVEISRSRNNQIKQVRNALGLVADYTFEDIIGSSKTMVEAKKQAMTFASSSYNVLIYGESGVGKELFAQSIHNYSERRNKPFVAINCASISPELIDSELFGYESGAFTGASKNGQVGKFELANGGTLFLDEVAELPLHAQTKLLRTLETHQITRIGGAKNISIDVRIIAATNRSLEKMIEEGLFREDLYYRLMVLSLNIPPLRSRPEDILPCSDFFLRQATHINKMGTKTLDDDTRKLMVAYDWPGNVRELRNVISRIYVLSPSSVITREILLSSLKSSNFNRQNLTFAKTPENRLEEKRLAVSRCQADLMKEALLMAGGNKTEAAKLLGVTRKTFYNMLARYKDFFT
ncbi:MAG: sigma 54-interacting transcriptional regulator [Firmicutes bacterium]|nr:sigma 54-interacting transcriptional regulator [Bacillota bacterium]